FEWTSTDASEDSPGLSTMNFENPYTGEGYSKMLAMTVRRTPATLKRVASEARAGQWTHAYRAYERAPGQLDAWVLHQLTAKHRDDEAKKLEAAIKLKAILDKVSTKPNPK